MLSQFWPGKGNLSNCLIVYSKCPNNWVFLSRKMEHSCSILKKAAPKLDVNASQKGQLELAGASFTAVQFVTALPYGNC